MWFLLLVLIYFPVLSSSRFSEDLFISPLEDGRVFAHFQFEHQGAAELKHAEFFPKSLGQILNRFGVQELSLALSHGHWRHAEWGNLNQFPLVNTSLEFSGPVIGPSGAEIWANLNPTDGSTVQNNWNSLLNALAGIFCSSLNSLKPSETSIPVLLPLGDSQAQFMYGSLPREAVCTENLTPWLKLLPCRNQVGIGSLIKPTKVVL
jgi:phosphatidylinositol glycan class T